MTGEVEVHGSCAPGFERVRRVFANNFTRGLEVGAAITVYVGDEPVVDLWAGLADHRTGRPWEQETPCFAFSCTKAMTAAAALRVAELGGHDLRAPVASWWPEFAVHGKEATTGEHLLAHQAGLPAFDGPVTVTEAGDPAAMAARLAAQAPEWEPGTEHGYHTFTFGWLAGEIVRRLDGRTVGAYVADEIATPLGLDLWIGAPDDVLDRAARLTVIRGNGDRGNGAGGGSDATEDDGVGPGAGHRGGGSVDDPVSRMARAARDPGSRYFRSMRYPDVASVRGRFNNREVLSGGWPAAGVVTTSAGLAGFYRDLLAGRVLSPETLRDAITTRAEGPDGVLHLDSAFGLGFMRPSLAFPAPRKAQQGAFGHTGSGGSIGLADIDHDLAIGYVMNGTGAELSGGTRALRLVKAVYDSLD